ncbi:MAG: GtrA family protein [Methanoregula sp.]
MDDAAMVHMQVKTNSLFERTYSFFSALLHDPASIKQIFKFCGVGILNTIVGYSAFFILVNFLNYLLALLIAHIIGVLHSYLWNKYWIFRSRKFSPLEFIKFNVIYAMVFIVNAIALFVCVEIIQANPRIAQLLLLPVITIISFFGQKLWTFNEKIDSAGERN